MSSNQRRAGRRSLAVSAAMLVLGGVAIAVAALRGSDTGHDRAGRTVAAASTLPTAPASDEKAADSTECVDGKLRGPDVPTRTATRAELRAFPAAVAVTCTLVQRRYSDGIWSVELRQTADAPFGQLLTALDRPDAKAVPGTSCTLYLEIPPQLVLVDRAGRYLRPHFPVDGCDHLRAGDRSAVNALHWRTVELTKLNLDVPNDPVRRTCQTAWKDMIDVPGTHPAVAPGGSLGLHGSTIVCIYRRTTDLISGDYVRGLTLDAVQTTALDHALDGPGRTARCTDPSQFAVTHTRNRLVYVELGGCYQVLRPSGALGSADGTALQALIGS